MCIYSLLDTQFLSNLGHKNEMEYMHNCGRMRDQAFSSSQPLYSLFSFLTLFFPQVPIHLLFHEYLQRVQEL